jgi:pyruvate formate lyase activating enzyme
MLDVNEDKTLYVACQEEIVKERKEERTMKGYGLIPVTLTDYPGLVAACVFTAGCNLRCPWCHNPGLVIPPWDTALKPEADILDYLERRRGVLQGVAVTGGEPLYQPDLPLFLDRVKALGLRVKLDTNGTYPDRLAAVARGRVDYVAVDIKNAPSAYVRSAGLPVKIEKLRRTLHWARENLPDACEVRLTWVPGLNSEEELDEYAALVGAGIPVWVQGYRDGPTLDPRFRARAPSRAELETIAGALAARGLDARVRG